MPLTPVGLATRPIQKSAFDVLPATDMSDSVADDGLAAGERKLEELVERETALATRIHALQPSPEREQLERDLDVIRRLIRQLRFKP